jgi:plastocyanin
MKTAGFLLLATLAAAASLSGRAASARSSFNCPTISYAVDILDAFSPNLINVSPGAAICWRNQDARTHRVTSDTGAFDSGDISPGGTYWFSFNGAGPHTYHDALYPSMKGTVYVTPGPRCPYGARVVTIVNGFSPATVDVWRPDATICWSNDDGGTHTVTSDTGAFDSADIPPGGSYSFTFNSSGSYAYHDALNPSMTGKINVDPPYPPPQHYCPSTAEFVVDMNRSYGYKPAALSVASGTTVCWKNQDGWEHTVTSDTGYFDSGVVGLDAIYSFTFEKPGRYAYHDSLYSSMKGTVYVDSFIVPRVIGLKLSAAKSRIRHSHGSVGRIRWMRSRRVGRVIAQKPAPRKRLAMGARVSLVVGRR